ncbi:alpha/beta hydrolase fold protein [Denitrovibrio acetiphilus DSM 12809]|uniref:Alpha/beta hydrolase fold protein n=1 Tax=Denitrovibrio acetiphilus (strain DSM 12809 / NBRC 114555 / N2460) TaxID=522772 RepID=D4H2G2_DENA2|nr:alpha/beta hydrolase [Denitrovibrio acetiphilus]ADD68953.1 alpha/beta hydrolase fold protein [Denitrovibrio acetiphilus DSM 12809]
MKVKVNFEGLDINVHVDKKGDKGQNLLFVHGIPTNGRLWRHVQDRLQGKYQTYAIDLVGYGRSDMPLNDFEHSLMNQAEVLKLVIEELGLKGNVILIGHDHGGGVSQVFASRYCDYIKRLVLLDPICFDLWPVCEVEILAALDGAPDEILMQAQAQTAAGFPGLMRMGSYDGTPFTDKSVKENYLQYWGRDGLTGFKSLIRVSTDAKQSDTDVDYTKIKCPTMVMWGAADCFMPKETAFKLKAKIAGPTRTQIIEKAGHYAQEDRPDDVAHYIDDFITEWDGVAL